MLHPENALLAVCASILATREGIQTVDEAVEKAKGILKSSGISLPESYTPEPVEN
jgi:hypothetical protein